jgi:hypothetical protein
MVLCHGWAWIWQILDTESHRQFRISDTDHKNTMEDLQYLAVDMEHQTHLRRAPPGRLGSSLIRFPAMSLLFKARRAASAALTS